jgi:hypothetical protein
LCGKCDGAEPSNSNKFIRSPLGASQDIVVVLTGSDNLQDCAEPFQYGGAVFEVAARTAAWRLAYARIAGRLTRKPRAIPIGALFVKGVVLAGAPGRRWFPPTRITNKHLLPIYDKPMINYPGQTME